MDFALSEEQEIFRDSTRKFLETECHSAVIRELEKSDTGHSPELWKKMAALCWSGINIPEQYGGAGLGLLELAILLEEIGAAAFDSPLFSTLVATLAILEAGSEEQHNELLPDIAAGEMILTLAVEELEVAYEPRFVSSSAVLQGDAYVVNGTKQFVCYANVADKLLVLARTSGLVGDVEGCTLFMIDAKATGIKLTALETIAPDRQFAVAFSDVCVSSESIVGEEGQGLSTLHRVFQKGTALVCAQMLGGAEHQLEATAEYAKQREQFDRPIGSFQAVQHHLANMYTLVQGSRWTSYQAVERLSRDKPAAREVAIAKAFTSDACQQVAALAQQLHGGVGVDMDNDLQFYFRRAKALELKFGPSPVHLKKLGEQF